MKPFYLLTLFAALAFAGCGDDKEGNSPPPSEETDSNLTIEQTDYTLGALDDNKTTVSFTSKVDWTLSIEDAGDDTYWLTVDTQSGSAGEQQVTIEAYRQARTESRTAYVDIVFGDETQRLTVVQNGAEGNENLAPYFDPIFAQALASGDYAVLTDANQIYWEDIKDIAMLACEPSATILSVNGIEFFESVAMMTLNYMGLQSLDVSQNKKLGYLVCIHNQLKSVNLGQLPELAGLELAENQLETLDLSGCPKLVALACDDNQLTSLDVSQNTALTNLDCSSNSLTSLDVSNNPDMEFLEFKDNPGDGESTFPVTVWDDFDLENIPSDFTQTTWKYEDKDITPVYKKAE